MVLVAAVANATGLHRGGVVGRAAQENNAAGLIVAWASGPWCRYSCTSGITTESKSNAKITGTRAFASLLGFFSVLDFALYAMPASDTLLHTTSARLRTA